MAGVSLQQALPCQINEALSVKLEGNEPGGCTNYAITLILGLDGVEFEIDKLSDITNEGQNLANPIVNQRKSREEIHDSTSDRLYALAK